MKNVTEFEIDIFTLIRAVWKKGLIISLVAILFGCAAFGITAFLIEPRYEATASMYVNNSSFSVGATSFSITSSDLTASNSLVSVYLYILESRTTLEEVIQVADLTYTPDELAKMVSASSVAQTGAFEVTVTSTNPMEAELIANSIAQILPDRIAEIVDGTSVRVVDYAIIPSKRSGPSVLVGTALGMIVGGLMSVLWIVIKFIADDSGRVIIQSVDDLRDMYPEIMVLATIPDTRLSEKKNGYYSAYYAAPESGKKEGKRNGRH